MYECVYVCTMHKNMHMLCVCMYVRIHVYVHIIAHACGCVCECTYTYGENSSCSHILYTYVASQKYTTVKSINCYLLCIN